MHVSEIIVHHNILNENFHISKLLENLTLMKIKQIKLTCIVKYGISNIVKRSVCVCEL